MIVPSDPATSVQITFPAFLLGLSSTVTVVVVATRAPMAKVGTEFETVTVALAELELLKSTVWLLTESFDVTTQLAFGAFVLHENVTRPEPVVPAMSMVVVLPLVAPAVTVMFPVGVSCGAIIADGRYCRT